MRTAQNHEKRDLGGKPAERATGKKMKKGRRGKEFEQGGPNSSDQSA